MVWWSREGELNSHGRIAAHGVWARCVCHYAISGLSGAGERISNLQTSSLKRRALCQFELRRQKNPGVLSPKED